MKNNFFLLAIVTFLFIAAALESLAQTTVYFSYDDTGNRTLRSISVPAANLVEKSAIIDTINFAKQHVFDDKLGDQLIKIYPNPTHGKLKVDIIGYDLTQATAINVYNISGSLILQRKPAKETEDIDLTGYPNSTYIMRIIINGKVSEWKIIKQ